MNIAVIGAGNMGAGLARLFASSGHQVVIGARQPEKAAALAAEIGSQVQGGGIAAAVKLADIVVLALPYGAAAEALKEAGDLSGKVVVDISNPLKPDFSGLVIGHTTSAAEEIQALVGKAVVVKAFNTVFAQLLPREARAARPLQVFVAADDAAAKAKVTELAASAGFEPVDAGPLGNARYLEPIGMMNIAFGYFLGRGPTVAPAWASF
ncbi:NADPH-dependent F420 reductase [Pinisolibacter aquiterrae]|uniref:NADPH-dependent F420 reductase n=1 Tax=Pinisolibacter aquiterrae TaxID=2815579 RepID=UPI001C3C36D7|nr:NADPH-dependent F420 reductase [Pinisolibacter aquiterrae]MBV5266033.1 NADPH-dependent F420 reductase [Pinisolibacter aquiterrae]MCC8237110.1 NADPH-dependent F420 reductase [Pinisolibacter aquiterrae]